MAVITDMDGRPLTVVANPCGYYASIAEHPGAAAACLAEWRQFAGRTTRRPPLRAHPSRLPVRANVRVGRPQAGRDDRRRRGEAVGVAPSARAGPSARRRARRARRRRPRRRRSDLGAGRRSAPAAAAPAPPVRRPRLSARRCPQPRLGRAESTTAGRRRIRGTAPVLTPAPRRERNHEASARPRCRHCRDDGRQQAPPAPRRGRVDDHRRRRQSRSPLPARLPVHPVRHLPAPRRRQADGVR